MIFIIAFAKGFREISPMVRESCELEHLDIRDGESGNVCNFHFSPFT